MRRTEPHLVDNYNQNVCYISLPLNPDFPVSLSEHRLEASPPFLHRHWILAADLQRQHKEPNKKLDLPALMFGEGPTNNPPNTTRTARD